MGFAAMGVEGAVLAPDLSLGELKEASRVVWESPSVERVDEVVSVDALANHVALWATTTGAASGATTLPASIGAGLLVTFVGRLELAGPAGRIVWESADPTAAATRTVAYGDRTAPVFGVLGKGGQTATEAQGSLESWRLRGELRPVLVCASEPCRLEPGTVHIPSLSTAVATEKGVVHAKEILTGKRATLRADCRFSLSPVQIDFGTIRPRREGDRLAAARTDIEVVCHRGTSPGTVRMRLTPASGTFASSDRYARTSHPSLALVHRYNAAAGCGREEARSWLAEDTAFLSLEQRTSLRQGAEGFVEWGVCQMESAVTAGDFKATVHYDIWVD